jgi:PAS domain S-box-containing protein
MKVSKGEIVTHYETVHLTKRDKKIDVSLTFSPVLDDQGRVIGASTIASDISKRKLVEDRLGASEEKYRRLFETAQDGILILDEVTGKVIDANQFILDMTEYRLDELVGRQLWELGFIEDKRLSRTAFTKLKMDKYIRYEDLPLKKKSGKIFDVEFISNVYEVNGYAVIQCNIRDITDRKLIKDALEQTNRKLNLLSSITRHDIVNQLMALEGNLTLLDKRQFDDLAIERLQRAEVAAKRILSIIQFTKEYEDIGVKAPIWQNTRQLIEKAVKGVALGSINLVNDIPAELEIYADPLITKVFYNLIENAVRHGGKITTIRFYIEDQVGARSIICQDDGVGIAPDVKIGLFTHDPGKSHGFGLFLSREILTITGLSIREAGELEKGARFEITIPAGALRSR